MNYCEEKGISTSKLTDAQRTLYYIAENMKMDKSISKEGYEYFQQAIKALEEQNDWIPCSERMPKEREWIGTKRFGTTISNEVYITFEASNGERFCDHVRFQNGKLSESKQIELNAIAKSIKPVAWRELPQPWRGDNGV